MSYKLVLRWTDLIYEWVMVMLSVQHQSTAYHILPELPRPTLIVLHSCKTSDMHGRPPYLQVGSNSSAGNVCFYCMIMKCI